MTVTSKYQMANIFIKIQLTQTTVSSSYYFHKLQIMSQYKDKQTGSVPHTSIFALRLHLKSFGELHFCTVQEK